MLVKYLIILQITNFIYSQNNTAAVILARGGSKGIRLKNLQTVGSVSLIARAILTAKRAGIDDITVSTDHPLIALEAIKYDATVFCRNRVTASDWAPSIWGVSEFISSRKDIKKLILLQATSPFIRPEHLRKALKKLDEPIAFDCIFSVSRTYKLRWGIENERIFSANFNPIKRPRRQEWSGELLETGSFYIIRRFLLEEGKLQNNNCTVWEIPASESLEIDTHYDLEVANVLLKHNLV